MAFSDQEARKAFGIMKDSGRRPAHHPFRKQPLPAQPVRGSASSPVATAAPCRRRVGHDDVTAGESGHGHSGAPAWGNRGHNQGEF